VSSLIFALTIKNIYYLSFGFLILFGIKDLVFFIFFEDKETETFLKRS